MSTNSFLYNGQIYYSDGTTVTNSSGTPYVSVFNGEFQPLESAPSSFLSDLSNNPQLQQTILTASNQAPTSQTATPNPDAQSGSTPISPQPATPSSGSGSLKYPLSMEDGQDKIKFTILKLKKSTFGGQIEIKKPEYEIIGEPFFIGIQGGISDANGVVWGSGELNTIQKQLVNFSLDAMEGGMESVNKKIQEFMDSLTKPDGATAKALKGLGQLYLAEQATSTSGLISRATGQILNPNMELLFQNPTLRTFQFQFKMSPRNKPEADAVKKIIKTFKHRMAAKKEQTGLFLKAPNVFRIEYLKGMNKHKSLNLIKECALLNFSVDYTPNGTYMTYGGGDNGDPEASMVTYALSMAFQEIEPIYAQDYVTGEGETHPIGF